MPCRCQKHPFSTQSAWKPLLLHLSPLNHKKQLLLLDLRISSLSRCRRSLSGWLWQSFVRNMKNFDKFTVETITMNFIKNDTRCSYPTMQQQYFLMHFGGKWNARRMPRQLLGIKICGVEWVGVRGAEKQKPSGNPGKAMRKTEGSAWQIDQEPPWSCRDAAASP